MARGTSSMFLTGPDVVEAVTGERVTIEELGGADVHDARSGVAHLVADTEAQALELVKLLLATCPRTTTRTPAGRAVRPAERMDDELNTVIPAEEAEAYDVRDVLAMVFDRDSLLEIHPAYAPNVVVGFARLDGYSVGIVANQPAVMAGVLDIDASDKIARFIRICDVYNIPVITFVDCPGFLPGVDQEYRGVIRHGARSSTPTARRRSRRSPSSRARRWRRLRRDVVAPDADRRRVRLAGRPDRRDGRRGGRPDPVPARGPRGRRPGRRRGGVRRPLPRGVLHPYRAADVGQIDEVIEPARDAAAPHPGAGAAADEGPAEPAKKHGLFPA